MKQAILIFALITPIFALSQISIKGKVTDDLGPLVGANIILQTNDGTIKGTISNIEGAFTIDVQKGFYKLKISYLGYSSYEKEIQLNKNLDLSTILLKENSNRLEKIIIKSKKKLIEQKTDRIVFNVANNVIANSSYATDILKITPNLQISDEGITIFGKGNSQVMVNDKLIPLTGEDLITYLSTISGDDIKKIEIITAPPSKYEASGNGGLINIVLKTNKQNSWRNTLSVIHNIDTYNFTGFSNSFSYRKNKINFSANLDNTRGNIRGVETFQVYYPNSTWDIDIDTRERKEALSGRLLLDYNISKNTNVGIQYFGNQTKPGIRDNSITSIQNLLNTIDSLLVNNGSETQKRLSHSLNLHTITKLDTLGRTISVDADYFTYNADRNRTIKTESFDTNNNFQNVNLSAISTSMQSIKNKSIKVDIEHPFKNVNLSYGSRISTTNSTSNIDFFNTESGIPMLDTNISNTFEYKENNLAFYVNANKSINLKWQLQMGLRFENTHTRGFSKNLNKTNKNHYSQLFPTLYITYNKNKSNIFSFSYNKRIERPNFNNLNPFRVFISSNTYSEGNPFLQPTFTHNYELKHTYKGKLATNVFFNIKKNMSGTIFTSDIDSNTQIVTRDNFLNQYVFGLGESYVFNKLKWLQSQNSFTIIHIKSEFTKAFNAKLQNGFAYIVSSNNTIKLNSKNNLQINAVYDSKVKYGLYTVGSTFSLDLGYSRSYLNKSLHLSVLVKDVFNTSALNNLNSTVNDVKQVYGQNRNNRYLRFSMKYTFGSKKINSKKRQFGNEEETNRVN